MQVLFFFSRNRVEYVGCVPPPPPFPLAAPCAEFTVFFTPLSEFSRTPRRDAHIRPLVSAVPARSLGLPGETSAVKLRTFQAPNFFDSHFGALLTNSP